MVFDYKLKGVCQKLKEEIVSFRRIYDGNGKSHVEMVVDG